MSEEAQFHVSDYVNKQNCCYWALNNPHELHRCPLHSAKVTLWCAVNSHVIIGSYFFENEEGRKVTVYAEHYKVMLETFLQMSYTLINKFCCGFNKMEQLLTQQKFPCMSSGQFFQVDSFLILRTSPALPTRLTMQY
jgi:hypothetical protein